jgi:carbonic anhydrase
VYQSNAKNVYAALTAGNSRFARDSASVYRSTDAIPDSLLRKKPFFLLTDIDLPQSPDRIFDLRKSMFMQLSSPACLLDPKDIAVMEYAVMYSGTKVIMVLANSNSRIIGAACDNVQTGNFGSITQELSKAMTTTQEFADRSSANKNYVNSIAQNQANLSLNQILAQSPRLKALSDSGKVVLRSAYFDATKGTVSILEQKSPLNSLTKN